jgi:hypothetical protein
VDSVEQETGYHPGTYTLAIIPHVAIAAKADGQDLSDTFEPKLVFNFDKVHFYLAGGSKPDTDPLQSSKDGLLIPTTTQGNTVSVLGFEFGILELRILGLAGLGVALLGLLALGWHVYDATRRSQEAMIRIKYGALLIDVYERDFESIKPFIDVASIDDLAKLAEHQNAMILHMTRDYLQFYLVQSEGATYRFVISQGRKNLARTEVSHLTYSG